MARTWRIATGLALGALLLFSATALGGGSVTATLTDPADGPTAGGGTVIGVDLKQHGVTPISWEQLYFMGTNRDNGDNVFAKGRPEGPVGHYEIAVTFPSAGRWDWRLQTLDLLLEESQFPSITVAPATGGSTARQGTGAQAPAEAAAQQPGSAAPATTSTGIDPALAGGGGILAFLVGAMTGFLIRRSRRADEPVPVGGQLATR